MILGVTGHRPRRLALRRGDSYSLNLFADKVLGDLPDRPERVITGMALGWDQSIAVACLHYEIPFVAAVPFEGFEAEWPEEQQTFYRYLLTKAERVETLFQPGYSQKKLVKRNEWIVNNSNRIEALWDGYDDGGTASCVRFAKKRGVLVVNHWLDWREFDWREFTAARQ